MTQQQQKWDVRFLELAKHIAGWSKDPSTKCGCVVTRPDRTIAATGYNGFPRGVQDDDRLMIRDMKLEIVLHAEDNAILCSHERLKGCTCYVWPLPPCCRCASKLIQVGIAMVVSPGPIQLERWKESMGLAEKLFLEAGVEFRYVELQA